jgi:hypothetical protein
MELKPNRAKVVDIETSLDAVPVETAVGPVLWATVRLDYVLAGMSPRLDIRVPIPYEAEQTDAERARQALRNARLLIDHACQSSGIQAEKSLNVTQIVEQLIPTSVEGLAQELGLAKPATRPNRKKR